MASPRIIGGIIAGCRDRGSGGGGRGRRGGRRYTAVEPPAPQSFEHRPREAGPRSHGYGQLHRLPYLRGGAAFAGGRPLPTPFGTFYLVKYHARPRRPASAAGRTPAFRRALRPGWIGTGRTLPHLSLQPLHAGHRRRHRAFYAFLRTRAAVRPPYRPTSSPFPLNQRFIVGGLELFFLRHGLSARRRNSADGIAAPTWSKGWHIAGHAIPRATGWARSGRARHFLAATSTTGTPYAIERTVAFAGAVGHGSALWLIFVRGWLPIMASRGGRWPRSSATSLSVQASDVHAVAVYMTSVFGPPTQDRPAPRPAICGCKSSRLQGPESAQTDPAGSIDLRRGLRDLS